MSLRFRRSVKIIPGVRINFNKNSWGVTLGTRGAHSTWNSKGYVTNSVGLPGTGLWYTERTPTKSARERKIDQQLPVTETAWDVTNQAPIELPIDPEYPVNTNKPGLLASNEEHDLFKALQEISEASLREVANKHESLRPLVEYMLIPFLVAAGKNDEALLQCKKSWESRGELQKDELYTKYITGLRPQFSIAPGVLYTHPFDMVGLGVIYSELLQRVDKFQDALDILEKLPADEAIQIATCEIENQLSLYEKVLETTEVLHSADTVHEAILQVYRGIALRGTKNYLASIEVLTAAAKVKGNADVKNLALLERARTYQSMGDQAKALKDIQKILVTDTDFPGVEELRKELEAKP